MTIDTTSTENVTWNDIRSAISKMDGIKRKWTALTVEDGITPRIIVTGGDNNRFLVSFFSQDNDAGFICVNKNYGSGSAIIWDGGHYDEYSEKYLVTMQVVIDAFKYFFEFQDKHPELDWDE